MHGFADNDFDANAAELTRRSSGSMKMVGGGFWFWFHSHQYLCDPDPDPMINDKFNVQAYKSILGPPYKIRIS